MKVALQSMTLMNYMKTDEQIKETLKRVKEIGYNAIQISGIGTITKDKAELVRNECQNLNLEICATHTNLESLENNLDWIIEYHHLWNSKYVGIGMMPKEYMVSEDTIIDFCNKINIIGEKLAKAGLILIYHNHAFEFKLYNGKLGMDILLSHLNKYVQFEIDTYWVQRGGSNPSKWINLVKGKMDVVHFKDMGIRGWDEQFMEVVGLGNLDWDVIIKNCLDNNVLWACVEQDDCQGRDPFSCIKLSLDFLKSKGLK